MRYLIAPAKRPDPEDESGKRKIEFLQVSIWPGPWSMEHTAEEKIRQSEFDGDQAGLDSAVQWLNVCYRENEEQWSNLPSILDCEPDR